jgi:3,4-dihydroxy 2-butanone 4-phosphate synthase/GTP cyclohydrolase II
MFLDPAQPILSWIGTDTSSVDGAIEELRHGKTVLLVEPAGELTVGYLVASARTVTADTITAMLGTACGMPFVALPADRCDALGLKRVGPRREGRNFLVSIEAREGTTTGVSSADRARTMRVAADPSTTRGDIAVPGHIVPVRVEAEGVLGRAGASEAALELASRAGSPGGAALCHVLDAQGRPLAEADLKLFAREHDLRMVSTVDVLNLQLAGETLVQRDSDGEIDTPAGPLRIVSYLDPMCGVAHYAFVRGDVTCVAPMVRVHVQRPPWDTLGTAPGGARDELIASLAAVAGEAAGVLLYIASPITDATRPPEPLERSRAELMAGSRCAHLVAQILQDLGVTSLTEGSEETRDHHARPEPSPPWSRPGGRR